MERLTFRLDDVSRNTDFEDLNAMIGFLYRKFNAHCIAGVTILSKKNHHGSIYPNPPFKDKYLKWFYGVDGATHRPDLKHAELASHGLFHFDHAAVSYELQEMSIVSSCNYLRTELFIPPFNRWNKDTVEICKENDLILMRSQEEGWRSLEFCEFDDKHKKWYFHPWRFTIEEFRAKFHVGEDLG